MRLQEAISSCHVRSAIYRESKSKKKYFKNHPVNLMDQVPEEDRDAKDWMEWDPRDYYDVSLPFD
ncbi:hypothetical protein ES705_49153 [subsurface metagenome]